MRVRFNWRYQSSLGQWGEGAVEDITTALYDALSADSPGVVSVADDPILPPAEPPVVAVEDIPAAEGADAGEGKRQVRKARNRQAQRAAIRTVPDVEDDW